MADISTELSQMAAMGHYVLVGPSGKRVIKAKRGKGHARTEKGIPKRVKKGKR